MTPKEAIECLKNEKLCILIVDKNECTRECSKCDLVMETDTLLTAYDMAIKALGKQIPKKPLNVQDCYIPETYDYDYSVANCPNCRGAFSFDEYHRPLYCDKCGQKLSFEGLE